jgi:hypothetical protein
MISGGENNQGLCSVKRLGPIHIQIIRGCGHRTQIMQIMRGM